jgi:hypothetical protein
MGNSHKIFSYACFYYVSIRQHEFDYCPNTRTYSVVYKPGNYRCSYSLGLGDFTKKESLEIILPRSAFVTKRYNNNSNSDTFENDEFLNRANLEKVLCSQLSNVKGVHNFGFNNDFCGF